jgi:cell wall-associated NlpC family hydrolase
VQSPKAADLLVFRMRRNAVAKHVGILVGEGKFIHAYDGNCVVETWLSSFWQKCLVSSFVFPSVFESELS